MLLALAVSVIVVLFLVVSFFVLRHSLAQNNGPTTEPTQQTYTVVFENVDGSILSVKTYEEGAKVEIPEDPSYGPDVQYTYTFRSWDRAVELYVYSDAKYTALYDTSLNAYTITFVNYDGSEISRQTGYYGSEIEYVGATPRRPSRAKCVRSVCRRKSGSAWKANRFRRTSGRTRPEWRSPTTDASATMSRPERLP